MTDTETDTETQKQNAKAYRYDLALQIVNQFNFKTLRRSGFLHYFDCGDGTFKDGELYLPEIIFEKMGANFSTYAKREITEIVRIKTLIEDATFETPIDWVNLRNGAFNLLTGEFIKRVQFQSSQNYQNILEFQEKIRDFEFQMKELRYDAADEKAREKLEDNVAKIREQIQDEQQQWRVTQEKQFAHFCFTYCLPVTYDPDKDCPAIEHFLASTLTDSQTDIVRMFEFVGYLLWRDQFLKTFAVFLGEHDTGKTLFATVIRSFLGVDNVTALSMSAIMDDKFDKKKLDGPLAAISGELSPTFIKDTTLLKEITGEDLVSARLMHSQKDYKFKVLLKFIFLANKVPGTYEGDDAYYERAEIFEFLRQVEKGRDMDTDLDKKLTTPEELSGLFNKAVAGLRQLMTAGKLTGSLTTEQKKARYQLKADPFTTFLSLLGIGSEADMHQDSGMYITKKRLWTEFKGMCKKKNVQPGNERGFFTRLKTWAKENEVPEYRTSDSARERAYFGIYLKAASFVDDDLGL